jgi:hypothetical protein
MSESLNLFEQAARSKLRFQTSKGLISVEDLWDLPLTSTTGKTNLDDIAGELYRGTQDTGNISFVNPSKKENEEALLKFQVVKHIIDVRIAERDAAKTAREKAEKKQKIMAILDQKENQTLMNASPEDLRAMLESL